MRLHFFLLTTIQRFKVDFSVFCSICLMSEYTKPLVAKWPCCFKDIYIYIYTYLFKWFQSYLTERKQYVTYNATKSATKTVRCGVPQGSILGPLLFLIYINDIASVCEHTMPILFADDTNLFINSGDLLGIAHVLNTELENVSHWLKLSLNAKKTHYMILTSKRTSQPNHVIKIEGHKSDEVQNTKCLGVYLDNKINWKRHIDYIAGKVSRAIGMITKARKFLTYESLKTLYYSFVYPFLIYCNHVWGNACSTSLKKLVLL